MQGPARTTRLDRGLVSEGGSSGQVGIRGPKIPEALRLALKARLDARVDADVAQAHALRAEGINLLRTFVAETPREAGEMPEALVRLSELEWENERESFVTRFAVWDKKTVDQRGPTPELDYRVPRDLLGRVLRDYPWFDQYDLALYVDTVCLLGDLAFCYDAGALLGARDRPVDCTVVVIDNDGGGIFSFLPQSGSPPTDSRRCGEPRTAST